MNVLYVDNSGSSSAGAFHSLINLISHLRKFGINGYVAIPDRTNGPKLLEERDIPYVTMRACSYTWMVPINQSKYERMKMAPKYYVSKKESKKLAEYALEKQIDLVHDNTSASYMGSLVAERLDLPHIWHIREFMEEDFRAEFWKKDLAYSRMSRSELIIAISKAIKEKYKNKINNDIHVIYNGIDTAKFLNRNKQIFKGQYINILNVGRVSEAKGQKQIVEAVAMMPERIAKKVIITLAGKIDPEYRKKIEYIASKPQFLAEIRFLGQVENIKEVYEQADIFCMSSRSEAFGRVTVEAMLSGLPVIGADSGGTSELLQDDVTGYLFEQNNINDLANKLENIIVKRRKAIEIAKKGQNYALNNFSAERNAEEIAAQYRMIQNRLEK